MSMPGEPGPSYFYLEVCTHLTHHARWPPPRWPRRKSIPGQIPGPLTSQPHHIFCFQKVKLRNEGWIQTQAAQPKERSSPKMSSLKILGQAEETKGTSKRLKCFSSPRIFQVLVVFTHWTELDPPWLLYGLMTPSRQHQEVSLHETLSHLSHRSCSYPITSSPWRVVCAQATTFMPQREAPVTEVRDQARWRCSRKTGDRTQRAGGGQATHSQGTRPHGWLRWGSPHWEEGFTHRRSHTSALHHIYTVLPSMLLV